jgi:hypothetical protein
MIYLQESFITLSWDEASKTIIAEWKGFASLAKMQFALEKGLELIQQKKTTKWLGDTSNLAPFGQEASNWIIKDWIPRAKTAGLKYIAYVIPKSALTRMTLSNGTAITLLESAFFDSQDGAKAWLRSR